MNGEMSQDYMEFARLMGNIVSMRRSQNQDRMSDWTFNALDKYVCEEIVDMRCRLRRGELPKYFEPLIDLATEELCRAQVEFSRSMTTGSAA